LAIVAALLKITIVPLRDFSAELPTAVQQLSKIDPGAFSAATLPIDGGRRIIVHNDSHDWPRQRSNIAHEIAHVLLGHPFTLPIDTSGCCNVDRELEDEANWLGPSILVSDAAALHIVRSALDTEAACNLYGVSGPVLRMRINASGAKIRVKRSSH
jgi:Zn-dependent peptidase ImmA (M78 family)